MAQFSIKSKTGNITRAIGAPVYNGTYLRPGCLEFAEIASPVPIDWTVGDYVDYSRTGLRYRLYNTPKAKKQGEQNRYGASFVYENVQFFDIMKEVELAPFIDLVPDDNMVHFSTQNVVAFFGTPANVAERIEACLQYWFPSSNWRVQTISLGASEESEYLAATTNDLLQTTNYEYLATRDAELIGILATEAEFSVSGVSCLEALDRVNEIWGLGWSHRVSGGYNIITIGGPNQRTSSNTTGLYNRINDDGLVALSRSISNAEEMGTRLYAYGSMRNMPTSYYREKPIKDAASVDIEHLMLPINAVASLGYAGWGKTGNVPDARLAYIENSSAISKYGLIPRYAYFDGSDSNYPDIYPSIEGVTIGDVIDAKQQIGDNTYVPSLSVWGRDDRIDEIVSAVNPTDNGGGASSGSKYAESGTYNTQAASISDPTGSGPFTETLLTHSVAVTADTLNLVLNMSGTLVVATEYQPDVDVTISVTDSTGQAEFAISPALELQSESGGIGTYTWSLVNTSATLKSKNLDSVTVSMIVTRETSDISFTASVSAGTAFLGLFTDIAKTFTVEIPQIGFNILQVADMGEGKTISMKSGMCAGRDFPIKAASYVSSTDTWLLTLSRVKDDDTGLAYPNSDFEIAEGDKYVLLDISMPELYITMASIRLLKAAQKLLSDIDHEQPFYEPDIDSKKVYNEERVLREGMWMHLVGDEIIDNGEDYALIDTLRIDEAASNIPVYDVTLRKRKSVEWTENINKGTTSKSSSSLEETTTATTAGKAPDWFTVETITEDNTSKTVLKLNPKYLGMYAEGWISAGGLSDESGGGTIVGSLSDLSDVDDNLNPTQGQVLTYYDGEWTARNGGSGSLTLTGDVTGTGTSPIATTIATGAVTSTKLASDSVTTAKIVDGNVTTAKLADGAVTAAKITDATITNAKLEHPSMTLWGQTATLGGTVTGDLTYVGKITFDAQTTASSSGNVLEVVNIGTSESPSYALHSVLPIYSDSFVSAGGLSGSSGSGGTNVTLTDIDNTNHTAILTVGDTAPQTICLNGYSSGGGGATYTAGAGIQITSSNQIKVKYAGYNTLGGVLTYGDRIVSDTVVYNLDEDCTYYGIEMDQQGRLFVSIANDGGGGGGSVSPATVNVYGTVKVAAVRSSSPTLITGDTTSGRYYGVEMGANGRLFVNVPWESGGGGGGGDYVTLNTVQTITATKTFSSGIKLNSSSGLLSWDSTNSAWHLAGNFYADGWISAGGRSAASNINLSDLADISSTPTNGQVLVYNSSTHKWVPTTLNLN